MFGLIRVIIGVIIGLVILLLLRKKHTKKIYYICTYIIVIAIITGLAFIPFENLVYDFKSPEAVYKYYLFGEESVDMVIEGKESALVVGTKNNSFTILFIPRAKNGWKLGSGSYSKIVSRYISDIAQITVYKYKNADYYISVNGFFGKYLDLSDSCNSEFLSLEKNNNPLYYAHISDFNSEYWICVDGYKIALRETEGILLDDSMM